MFVHYAFTQSEEKDRTENALQLSGFYSFYEFSISIKH